MDKGLKKTIVEKQGHLLYTTLSEECAEVIQACTKIQREKFYGRDISDKVDNLLEEINDVMINIELIKEQLINEEGLNLTREDIDKKLQEWYDKKMIKVTKVFLI